eukprot:TRINITY_DN6398_c0_g2_i1.p1 TRINITY_DN6398_c0_g2~~TRINITY_DN6398_c0_g2_i1.p1  ORF type:complete len:281 (+),score=65.21 TRINITY_DN6398_c0_g2_i1:80-844(+)
MARAGTLAAACLAIFNRAALAARVSLNAESPCMHPCEASAVEVEGKLFTIGNRVDFKTEGQCLGQCGVVIEGWLKRHEGCEEHLEGSVKVSKTQKRKLCCQVHQCEPTQESPEATDAKTPSTIEENTPVTTTEPMPVTTQKEVPATIEEEVPVTSTEGKKPNGQASVDKPNVKEPEKTAEETSVGEQDVDEPEVQTDAPADMVNAFGASLADRLYKVFDSIDELEGFTISEVEEYMGVTLSAKDRARLAERGIN